MVLYRLNILNKLSSSSKVYSGFSLDIGFFGRYALVLA